jgi:hypothetical protein
MGKATITPRLQASACAMLAVRETASISLRPKARAISAPLPVPKAVAKRIAMLARLLEKPTPAKAAAPRNPTMIWSIALNDI